MKPKALQIVMGLQWLAIPLVAFRYGSVWDRLPTRLATHFNAAGQPNGWMPRDESLWFILGLLAFILTVFSLIVYLAQKSGPNAIAWALLGFSYFVVASITMANEGVLQYNLTGQPIRVSGYILAIPVPIALLFFAILASQRGSQLPEGKVLAEEVHGSHVWGTALLVFGLFAALAWSRLAGPARIPLGIVALVFLVVGGAAWSGFHYYFTPHGVDIRALGFRLKSIPIQQIQRYAIDRWKAIGGYGIRGIGNCRAYVWGNKGIWITTASERVFLGHSQPERLVRDMDRMMKFVKT